MTRKVTADKHKNLNLDIEVPHYYFFWIVACSEVHRRRESAVTIPEEDRDVVIVSVGDSQVLIRIVIKVPHCHRSGACPGIIVNTCLESAVTVPKKDGGLTVIRQKDDGTDRAGSDRIGAA